MLDDVANFVLPNFHAISAIVGLIGAGWYAYDHVKGKNNFNIDGMLTFAGAFYSTPFIVRFGICMIKPEYFQKIPGVHFYAFVLDVFLIFQLLSLITSKRK